MNNYERFADNESVTSNNKAYFASLKKNDPNYMCISYQKKVESKTNPGYFQKININIESYGSGGAGSKIRSATTGQRHSYLVGSADEDLFFKVAVVTELYGQKPLTLFYDSPEQYEKHNTEIIDSVIKEKWEHKYNIAFERRNICKEPDYIIVK